PGYRVLRQYEGGEVMGTSRVTIEDIARKKEKTKRRLLKRCMSLEVKDCFSCLKTASGHYFHQSLYLVEFIPVM
ncbi:MAG: hypothetical protein PHU60_06675, partial [Tissierellia bacterium]|nr:hypothetical protein [Tissierellia bacterium]